MSKLGWLWASAQSKAIAAVESCDRFCKHPQRITSIMSYEIALQIDQEKNTANLLVGEGLFDEGRTDGAFGYRARYADEIYLLGYIAGVQELPRHQDGQINYGPSPAQNLYADPKSFDRWVLSRD